MSKDTYIFKLIFFYKEASQLLNKKNASMKQLVETMDLTTVPKNTTLYVWYPADEPCTHPCPEPSDCNARHGFTAKLL